MGKMFLCFLFDGAIYISKFLFATLLDSKTGCMHLIDLYDTVLADKKVSKARYCDSIFITP
jgi:hypothetical protein